MSFIGSIVGAAQRVASPAERVAAHILMYPIHNAEQQWRMGHAHPVPGHPYRLGGPVFAPPEAGAALLEQLGLRPAFMPGMLGRMFNGTRYPGLIMQGAVGETVKQPLRNLRQQIQR